MIKKNRLYKDEDVVKAIFDEVFLYKGLIGKTIYDENNKIIKTLKDKGYFNPKAENIRVRIDLFKRYDGNEKDGFALIVREYLSGAWYTHSFSFYPEIIQKRLEGSND